MIQHPVQLHLKSPVQGIPPLPWEVIPVADCFVVKNFPLLKNFPWCPAAGPWAAWTDASMCVCVCVSLCVSVSLCLCVCVCDHQTHCLHVWQPSLAAPFPEAGTSGVGRAGRLQPAVVLAEPWRKQLSCEAPLLRQLHAQPPACCRDRRAFLRSSSLLGVKAVGLLTPNWLGGSAVAGCRRQGRRSCALVGSVQLQPG